MLKLLAKAIIWLSNLIILSKGISHLIKKSQLLIAFGLCFYIGPVNILMISLNNNVSINKNMKLSFCKFLSLF